MGTYIELLKKKTFLDSICKTSKTNILCIKGVVRCFFSRLDCVLGAQFNMS
ncbi:MAG: DUF1563 domain-containing protein [Cetobacterium sp.]